MDIEKFISPFIASQFPSFYREDGPNFIAFVKAYYEWMEQSGNPIYHSRRLMEYTDIDSTSDQFIKYFKNTFINTLPENILVDKKLLIKHIVDLYSSKGTPRSYELLFRILFNEDIELYYPGKFLFTSSEATWNVPKYIEVSDYKYLDRLIGKEIYSESGKAIVENYAIQKINNKVINSLNLSNVFGNFKFGEKIYCDDLYIDPLTDKTISMYEYSLLSIENQANYQLALNYDNAPVVFGSLSSVSIINGGSGYEVGDLLNVAGTGKRGIAKVSTVRNENGRVTFSLVDGGFGFTTNAVVTVTGGGGAGASFKVGDIANKEIFRIYTDVIDDYYNTQLDISSSGFSINVNSVSGTFNNGDTVRANANVVKFDVNTLSGFLKVGDVLTNSSLGISNLHVYHTEDSYLAVTGSDADLTNANLTYDVVLTNGSTGTVSLNSKFPKQSITSNGIVTSSNSTVITVNSVDGGLDYFIPLSRLTDANSGATANIVSTSRNTNWGFPKYFSSSNLDGPSIENILSFYDLEIGTITYLSQVNPGSGYSSNPTVEIVEPLVYQSRITDGNGGFYGYNAQVTAKAGTAVGVVSGVEIVDSGFGYIPDETVTMNSDTNLVSVTGISVVDLNGKGTGYWSDSKSFPSDSVYLQDSDYYQTFSYEIIANRMLSTYEQAVKSLIHPSGFKLFGSYINRNEFLTTDSELTQTLYYQFETELISSDTSNYTADTNSLTADISFKILG